MDGYNIATVLKRLEAATSRLEDIVLFTDKQELAPGGSLPSPNATNGSTPHRDSAEVVSPRSSTQAAVEDAPPLPKVSNSQTSGGEDAGLAALNAIRTSELADFVKLSEPIAEGVAKQAVAVSDAYNAMLDFVATASRTAKPAIEQVVQLLQPMNAQAALVEQIRDEYRKDRDLTNFLATVPAGAGALGWVTIEGKGQASGFIQEMRDSAQFYGNRVLKDRKDAKPWVDQYITLLEALRKVVAQHYPEGLQWNVTVAPASAPAPAPAPAAPTPGGAGGPPPPPPPPPSVSQLTANLGPSAPATSSSGGGLSGVFAELSQGESITSGLKPVDKKALKASKPPVPKSTKPKPGSAGGAAAAAAGAPAATAKNLKPRFELVESKWHVEDLEDRHDIEIQASMGQSVQIDNCKNCTIKILGKAATFNISRSKKVGLLVETMVASCDIVNCSDFGLQVTGTLPSLMIDQSSQGSIFLSEESIGVDIFTSQTTAINVNIPEGEPGAYREVPLGEQILHNIVNGNVRSTIVKHG